MDKCLFCGAVISGNGPDEEGIFTTWWTCGTWQDEKECTRGIACYEAEIVALTVQALEMADIMQRSEVGKIIEEGKNGNI